jgi:hypothetical protein
MTPTGQIILEYLKGGNIKIDLVRVLISGFSLLFGGFLVGLKFIIKARS